MTSCLLLPQHPPGSMSSLTTVHPGLPPPFPGVQGPEPTAPFCCPGKGFQIPEDKQVNFPKRLQLPSQGASVLVLSTTLCGRAGDNYLRMTKLRFGWSNVQLIADPIFETRFVWF